MIKTIKKWFKDYYSTENRIKRLERGISNLESIIGMDYHNPLGTAFDLDDSQEDFDNSLRDAIKRYEEKLLKLKQKLKDEQEKVSRTPKGRG